MTDHANMTILRFQRASLLALGGTEAHGKRLGNVPHVDLSRTHLNEYLIGHENLRELADARIVEMQRYNASLKRASLKRRRRTTPIKAHDAAIEEAGDEPSALADVIGWPWDPKNEKQFTEGFLSVSHDWFLDAYGEIDPVRVEQFKDFALRFMAAEFGREVIYARLDMDEKTPHVSFVIAPEHFRKNNGRRELTHAQHRVFGQKEHVKLIDADAKGNDFCVRSYELLQDRVAICAADCGLDIDRGARRAETERAQIFVGETVIKRKNISPSRGRELAAALVGDAEAARAKAEQDAVAIERRLQSVDKNAREIRKKREEVDLLTKSAAQKETVADRQVKALSAKEQAMEVGSAAILAEELAYLAPKDDRKESLTWGPNKPKDPERQSYLQRVIQPARDWLIGFAKRIWQITQREKDLAKTEAEQRRRAACMAEAVAKAGHSVPEWLQAIALGTALQYDRRSFPGAWSIPKDARADDVDARLMRKTNFDLLHAWRATRDAVALCDDIPDLRDDFRRGLAVIEHGARQRGFNLKTGRHHPERAQDPQRARIHRDELPESIELRPDRSAQPQVR